MPCVSSTDIFIAQLVLTRLVKLARIRAVDPEISFPFWPTWPLVVLRMRLSKFSQMITQPRMSRLHHGVCTRVKPLPEMGRVLGIIFTSWTSRLVTCWH